MVKVTKTKTGQYRITIPVEFARILSLDQGSMLKTKIRNGDLVFTPAS